MEFIDSHCHLHFSDFLKDRQAVLRRAEQAGITQMIAVGVGLDDSRRAIDLAALQPQVWASAGVHPHEAKDFDDQAKGQLRKLLNMSRIVAAGEIGLDYYRLLSSKAEQQAALQAQIEIGLEAGLPFIFHVRDAWSDFWQTFDAYPRIQGVIHSFSGGPKQLEQALSRGLYIALNGIVTFTKDQALLMAAKAAPLDKLLLETDAPFLLPAGTKDKICEPMHVRTVAEFLAAHRGESLEKIATSTTKNAFKLFGLDKK